MHQHRANNIPNNSPTLLEHGHPKLQNGTHEPSQIEFKLRQERIKIEVWRVGKRGLEGPKSRSGRSFEQLGTVWTILRASGVILEACWGRLGSFLGPSWGARRPSLGRLACNLEAFESILGCLRASDRSNMKHSVSDVVFWKDFIGFWIQISMENHWNILEESCKS